MGVIGVPEEPIAVASMTRPYSFSVPNPTALIDCPAWSKLAT
jgi:hypothetical protein